MFGGAALAVIGFGACSSMLLVINKVAFTYMPAPGIILFMQCALTAVSIRAVGASGQIALDPLFDKRLLRAYLPVALGFLATLYSNGKALQFVNVETFIVCRNSTPVVVSLLDWFFLGRELPSLRSALCILGMIVGATGYVMTDAAWDIHGYGWLGCWLVAFLFDQIYIKHVVESVSVKSNWTRAMLTNAWAAFVLLFVIAFGPDEMPVFFAVEKWTPICVAAVTCSCVVAVFIAYFSFLARKELTATAFTILGNACKIISVIVNATIWEKHATPVGMSMLGITLLFAYFYRPAPMRRTNKDNDSFAMPEPMRASDLEHAPQPPAAADPHDETTEDRPLLSR